MAAPGPGGLRMGPHDSFSALVISRDGEPRQRPLTADKQVALWSRVLHRGAPGLVELVVGHRRDDGALVMRSRSAPERFPRAGDHAALVALARRHRGPGREIFCTPLTRREPRPGKAGGILPARCAWVDIDDPRNLERLRAFAPRPHLVVFSGSGGAHAYWRLAVPLPAQEVEAVNRKLAQRLGADLGSTDRARIMRLPGTHNHKSGSPCRIVFCDLASPGVGAARLVVGLEDPDPPPPPRDPAVLRRWARWNAADGARRIPPPVYFWLLARVAVPERGGDVRCPLPDHEERNPSCRVYPTPERGWICFGCQRGGTIYDLASLMEGGPGGRRGALRDEAYRQATRRVHELLGHDRLRGQ